VRDRMVLDARNTLWLGLRHTRLDRSSINTDGSNPVRVTPSFTTPWLAMTHEWTPGTQAYGSYGQGVEIDAAPSLPQYSNAGQPLPAMRSKQLEFGLKNQTGPLRWQLAWFDITRPQSGDSGACSADGTCLRQIDGQTHNRGLELGGTYSQGPWLLHASSAWIQSERQNASIDDIELGHILIDVSEKATDTEVAALQARAETALAQLKRGDDLARVAKEFSNGAERDKGGLMGLRPANRYPTLFVDATKSLNIGDVTLVRSGAGFHVLKLVTKRASNVVTITQTHPRHILLRPGGQLSQTAARAQLAEYKRQIEAGKADFAKLAREHSQDGSAAEGGDLGWVSPGMFVPEFEEVMNKLQPGQIADPTISRFGVHLIQVLERREAPISERELRDMARNQLREKKFEETYQLWAQEVRGRAYVEYRDPPQ